MRSKINERYFLVAADDNHRRTARDGGSERVERRSGASGTDAAIKKASKIIELSVDPIAGKPAEPSDGLLYGLIQSGKTSILTVSAAMAATTVSTASSSHDGQ